MRLRWSHVLILARWEIRSALRDRTIVVNTIVLPLVLYPLILWAVFNGIAFVRGQTDDMVSRVTVQADVAVPALEDWLRQEDGFRLDRTPADRATADSQVRSGQIDAVLAVQSMGREPYDLDLTIIFDGARERSTLARSRLDAAIARFRAAMLEREAHARGVTAGAWAQFAVERRDTASERDAGALVLGLILPLVFVVMVALGCMHPAIDSTAGERERGTWETLLTSSASRTSIVVAKYLSVTALGGLAGVLNVAAMLLTIRGVIAPLTGRDGEALDFHLPWAAIPVLVAGAVLLAALMAAGMMVLAAFARTFREGQTLVMPLYVTMLLPVMFLSTPTIGLTPATALIPVVNVALAVREAIHGRFDLWPLFLTLGTSLAAIGALLHVASLVLSAEQVIVGAYSGNLVRFLRNRWPGRGTPAKRESAE